VPKEFLNVAAKFIPSAVGSAWCRATLLRGHRNNPQCTRRIAGASICVGFGRVAIGYRGWSGEINGGHINTTVLSNIAISTAINIVFTATATSGI
jgi:hypothetical protein